MDKFKRGLRRESGVIENNSLQNDLLEKLIDSIDEETANKWSKEVRESRDEWDEQVNWENKID